MANIHNPVLDNLNALVSHLMDSIFEADQRRIDKISDALVDKYAGSKDTGLTFNSLRVMHSDRRKGKGGRPINWIQPPPEASEEMENLKSDITRIKKDYAAIRQLFVQLVGGMQTLQDIRDSLPDEVVDLMNTHIKALPRTRPPAWVFEGDEKRQALYARLEPTIMRYIAAKFLF